MLKDSQIPKAAAGMHSDGGGLYLRVQAGGKKVWVKRTRTAGADKWETLGSYPSLSLAEARRAVKSNSVEMSTALSTYKSKLSVKRPDLIDELLRPLHSHKVTVSKSQLVAQLQEKAKTAPVMANRMLSRWFNFFAFCEMNGWVESNPLAGVQRKFVGGKEESRERNLDWTELYNAIPRYDSESGTQATLLFILLTGLRPSEALWVLRTKQTENIPTKTTLHRIPRTRLIDWALKNAPNSLPSTHLTLSNFLRRRESDYTPHDLRRTFASRLADLGVMPHVTEKLLNHKMIGVMSVYNRAEYWPERVHAMRLWHRELLRLRKRPPTA
jgi:integrase